MITTGNVVPIVLAIIAVVAAGMLSTVAVGDSVEAQAPVHVSSVGQPLPPQQGIQELKRTFLDQRKAFQITVIEVNSAFLAFNLGVVLDCLTDTELSILIEQFDAAAEQLERSISRLERNIYRLSDLELMIIAEEIVVFRALRQNTNTMVGSYRAVCEQSSISREVL